MKSPIAIMQPVKVFSGYVTYSFILIHINNKYCWLSITNSSISLNEMCNNQFLCLNAHCKLPSYFCPKHKEK